MRNHKARVKIPRKAESLLDLGEGIIVEHNVDPTNSPLNALDMADFTQKVTAARAKQNEAKQLRMDSETATQDRNHLLGLKKGQSSTTEGTVLNYVTRTRDILLGVHKGKEQHLGDYTFQVDDSPRKKNKDTTPVPPATQTGNANITVRSSGTQMPIAGASVQVTGTQLTAITDAQGAAALANVPSGQQMVKVSAPGHLLQELPVAVPAGGAVTLNVVLMPMP